MTKTGCVILNYNDADNVVELVSLIKGYASVDVIVVVDNCSTDDSLLKLKPLNIDKVYVVQAASNGGYGAGNNLGVKICAEDHNCDFVLIANPDVRFEESCVIKLIEALASVSNAGAASCRQLLMDGKEAPHSAWGLPSKRGLICAPCTGKSPYVDVVERGEVDYRLEVDCLAGAMLMVRSSHFLEIGGYDERVFLFAEEMILAKRLKEYGFISLYLPYESYSHLHSASVSKSYSKRASRLKIQYASRRFLLKEYYDASSFDLAFFNASCSIRLLIEKIRDVAHK